MAFSRSPLMACAVSPITGTLRVASSAFTHRVASHPSMTGRLMSIRMMSGFSLRASATPCFPSTAKTTSKPRRVSRRDSMSRFISLSSTSKTFVIPLLLSRSVPRATPQCLADGRSNINVARRGFFHHCMNLPQKAIVLDRRELLCGDYDYGDFAPFRAGGEYVEEPEPVHFRHHKVEPN